MIWEEDNFEPRKKQAVGRPVKNPFRTKECEEDFVRCAGVAIERFFHPEPNSRLEFVFTERLSMSKSRFWSIIFIYYKTEKGLDDNLQGFISIVNRNFGTKVISDRKSLWKNICMLDHLFITEEDIPFLGTADEKARKTYRSQYSYVVRRWQECSVTCNM